MSSLRQSLVFNRPMELIMLANSEKEASYGVLDQRVIVDDIDRVAEQITYLGYSVVESGYTAAEIDDIRRIFDETHRMYMERYGERALREIDEHNGIRLPLAFDDAFLRLAANARVIEIVKRLVRNKFVLNQQNAIINPSGKTYNQALWHRDLPYQHFVSSKPLAINALYCVDEFTTQNGATFVLPASHTQEAFPSDAYIESNAKQVVASAGSFIVLDCMVFHRGGPNGTSAPRRAVNHVYTTAFIKQQIDIPSALGSGRMLSPETAELLGFRYRIPGTVDEFLRSRRRE